jgi:hypothetical protein
VGAVPLGGGALEPVTGIGLPLGGGCGGFASATPDHWWSYACSEPSATVTEISLADHTRGISLTVPPNALVLGDSDAGLLVSASGGGAYIAHDDGSIERIAEGFVNGRLGAGLLVTSCDDHLVCRFEILDPVTGGRVDIDLEIPGGFGYLGDASATTPDGSVAVLLKYDQRGPVVLVVDVRTGSGLVAPVGDPADFDGGAAISPDGTWVFWSANGLVHGWHVGDGDVVEVDLAGRALIGGY